MATLEDKILGEKLQNYCSSSEDEGDSDSGSEEKSAPKQEAEALAPAEVNKWEGTATNTGPKGVLKDWQRYKQLESEKRAEQEREKLELIKKLTLTCRTTLEDEKAKEEDPELAELLDDEFFLNYQKQRMQEMLSINNHTCQFNKVFHLKNDQDFLNAIDQEHKNVTVIIHIYEDNNEACRVMNSCLDDLCTEYPMVKFCTIIGTKAGISARFKSSGVPALLVYKSGQLVGNFVRVSDQLGNDFCSDEVRGFLIEHGMLLDPSCTPKIIRQVSNDGSDSD